jgi:hypothetical protein
MRRLALLLALAALTIVVVACGSNSPTEVPTSQLTFIRVALTAPPLANAADSFWAKKGQNRQIQIYFRPAAGMVDSSLFLEFKVDAQSLYKRPDGTLIADGDSVLIHVTVSDPVHLIVTFQPSGLQFSASKPARLKYEFLEADEDLNSDGVVNATDATLKAQLQLYRQETTGGLWSPVSAVIDTSINECDSDIYGFTNYALAY